MKTNIVSSDFISQCFGLGESPVDLYKNNVNDVVSKLSGDSSGSSIEANLWIPYAAECYDLSKDIRDYVLVPVPALFTDIPNTNGDSASLRQLLQFSPKHGRQSYKTFCGKPCFLEHDNKDILRAKGVILDSYLRPLKRFGNGKYYKMVQLLAYDRTKDPMLVNSILSGEDNAYSVGFYFKSYTCSICGHRVGKGGYDLPCEHTRHLKPLYKNNSGRLAYRQCEDIEGFECSSVASPAYISAVSPHVMNVGHV